MVKEDIKFSAQGGPASGWDVAIVGGGPAGIMSAIISSESGARVALLEKNIQLGRKLLLTGNGRCNITNAEFDLRKLVENYGKGGKFLFHAFSVFGPKEAINFFNKLGIKTKIENKNRVFPVSNNAKEVLEALIKKLEKNRVEVFFNSEIIDIKKTDKKIVKIILKDREVVAKKYIFCTGGKSYSSTGSDGLGYKLMEKLGHTIIKPRPALSPIKLSAQGGPASGWKDLQGINLEDIGISVFQNGKKQFQQEGEVMFTHSGVSGPAILNVSGLVGDLLEKGDVEINFDLFPLLNYEELSKGLEDTLKQYPNKTVKNILSIFVPERLAEVLSGVVNIDGNKIANSLPRAERTALVKILKNFKITVQEILGLDGAMVTRGGVSLQEIDHKTMKSKIINNLFFAGEIIDIDGRSGGFNLQSCWSTGYLAGKNKVI